MERKLVYNLESKTSWDSEQDSDFLWVFDPKGVF